MGLPLYRASVESDIKVKVPKDPPTRARSTIRRSQTRRNIHDPSARPTPVNRFARRTGRLPTPPTADSPWTPWDSVNSNDANDAARFGAARTGIWTEPFDNLSMTQRPDRENDPSRPTRQIDAALREVASRSGMNQEVERYLGQHMARLYAGTSSRSSQNPTPEGDEPERPSAPADEDTNTSWISSFDRPTPSRQTPRLSRYRVDGHRPEIASTRLDSGTQQARVADVAVLRHQDGHIIAMRRVLRSSGETAARDAERRATASDTAQEGRFDGLGDRDRSLSPEGDGVWDTLLSSITPDPQPPSAGTSFASASAPASAATSQTTTNSAQSSNTSTTEQATLDLDFEHPCESGGENSDTEGDDDDESGENSLQRFGRTYADAVGRSESTRGEDDFEVLGRGESMRRIVRNLAAREDIPDEWWAEAGLTRTLSREAA